MTLAAVLDRILGLHGATPEAPVLVGVDGWVAAGKSTFAASLAGELQMRGVGAAVVAADGFLLPAAALREAGLTARKGFPESFDRGAMTAFVTASSPHTGQLINPRACCSAKLSLLANQASNR